MSKASERKARKLANQYNAARLRFANGNSTPRDMDMLARMQAEAMGKNGYTGESRGNPTVSKPNGSANHTNSNPYTFRVVNPKDEHVFVCAENNEVTGQCPLNPKVPYILIPVGMWANFLTLAKKFKTEWMALLKGELVKDDKGDPVYMIKAFYFPPQNAGPTHVDIPTGVSPKAGTIGAIHSHVNMSVFFSGTDLAHSNWPVEIVINAREEYKAVARHQLKCGEWAKNDATVYTDGVLAKAEVAALELAFQQGSMLEKGLARPHTPKIDVSTPPQASQDTKDTPKDTAMTTPSSGTTGDTDKPDTNPNLGKLCDCGHLFGVHYRAPYAKENFPNSAMAGMCMVGECKCSTFLEISANKKDEIKQLTLPTGEGIITSLVSDDPDDTLSEETCEVCEGVKYVTETHKEGVREISKTRICPACGGDGLSKLGKVRLAEMEQSMGKDNS